MCGNSTCQWKKRYWRARSLDLFLGGGQFEGAIGPRELLEDRMRDGGRRVSSVLGRTNAAHQASASSFASRSSADVGEFLRSALLVNVQVFQAVREARAISAARLARAALVTGMPPG